MEGRGEKRRGRCLHLRVYASLLLLSDRPCFSADGTSAAALFQTELAVCI